MGSDEHYVVHFCNISKIKNVLFIDISVCVYVFKCSGEIANAPGTEHSGLIFLLLVKKKENKECAIVILLF